MRIRELTPQDPPEMALVKEKFVIVSQKTLFHFLAIILLAGCRGGTSATTVTQPAEAETPQLSSQYEITQADNGKSFVYTVTTRFTVILDPSQYPQDELHCQPEDIIGTITNIPAVQPPLYAARYETLKPGDCTLQDRDFHVLIRVVD